MKGSTSSVSMFVSTLGKPNLSAQRTIQLLAKPRDLRGPVVHVDYPRHITPRSGRDLPESENECSNGTRLAMQVVQPENGKDRPPARITWRKSAGRQFYNTGTRTRERYSEKLQSGGEELIPPNDPLEVYLEEQAWLGWLDAQFRKF